MRRVFVDTSAFVALRNKAEREHEAARAARTALVVEARLFTTNYIFAETFTTLMMRVGRAEAIAWGRGLRETRAIELLRVDEGIEEEAWRILESHADKTWSYVDAVSFAVMDREGSSEAFTFDRHFAQRGHRMLPPGV
ncbi:MAG: type II toxin-antitoxin system VapC family toxin [Actinomycetota bacterium]